jgi:hypothetical protein
MKLRRVPAVAFLVLQVPIVAAFAWSYASLSPESQRQVRRLVVAKPQNVEIPLERDEPLQIAPLYDDPELVSDEELAAVLQQIVPRFSPKKMKPNHVEHALRAWHIDAKFQDPEAPSGEQLRDFLIDYATFAMSWKPEKESESEPTPLLQERADNGVYVQWGREASSASVHHDHLLACLTEAGIPLSQRVFTPNRRDLTFRDVLRQALRDFRFDERETEWSVMAFGLWLPPTTKSWRLTDGREMSFDLLAQRLLRGHKKMGTCGGTHRLYSLMVLLRLDEQFDILSDDVQAAVFKHLESVRDILKVGQFEDGHWPYNWPSGEDAVKKPDLSIPLYRHVIATGHHLEWLAIAPESLHPPREQIRKAADWVIAKTVAMTDAEILDNYTFYSHVGNALCLWRQTNPSKFWREWEQTHPFVPKPKKDVEPAPAVKITPGKPGQPAIKR